jgi:hypothetical protein
VSDRDKAHVTNELACVNYDQIRSPLDEYGILKYMNPSAAKYDYHGVASEKKARITILSFREHCLVAFDQGDDCMVLCPLPATSGLFNNLFEQRETSGGTGMVDLAVKLGLLQMHSDVSEPDSDYSCSYFVGSQRFGTKYLAFMHSLSERCMLDASLREVAFAPSSYFEKRELPLIVFVLERAWSVLLERHSGFTSVKSSRDQGEILKSQSGDSYSDFLSLIDQKKTAVRSADGIRLWSKLSVEIASDFRNRPTATFENSRYA